jgi:hypothetical protein
MSVFETLCRPQRTMTATGRNEDLDTSPLFGQLFGQVTPTLQQWACRR